MGRAGLRGWRGKGDVGFATADAGYPQVGVCGPRAPDRRSPQNTTPTVNSAKNLIFCETFQFVERRLRLARAERIGIDRGKTIQRGGRSCLRRVRHAGRRKPVSMRIASRAEPIEARELRSRLADRIGGNAGELGDLQTVASVGRPLGDLVQKHDAVLVLDRVEVDIGAALQL